jgi:exodeoxyribonuclease V alpha subunit
MDLGAMPATSTPKKPSRTDLRANPPREGEKGEVRGTVSKVYFSKPEFTTGEIVTGDRVRIKFAGPVVASIGDLIHVRGKWKNHDRFGMQLDIKEVVADGEMDADGLAQYLSTNPRFKHLGNVRAMKLAREFGDELDKRIRERPDVVMRVAQLSPQQMREFAAAWVDEAGNRAALTWMAKHGLTDYQRKTLLQEFGGNVREVLERDPFIIMRRLDGFGFKRSDEIARKMGVPKDSPGRLEAGVMHTLYEEVESGHTWTSADDLLKKALKLLVLDDRLPVAQAKVRETIESLTETGRIVEVPISSCIIYSLQSLYGAESFLAARFAYGVNPRTWVNPDTGPIKMPATDLAEHLNEQQCAAVLMALTQCCCFISGAAGTGKTTIVKEILRQMESRGLSCAMCAPTGKAAKRMEEAVGKTDCAATIHRLLGYDPKNDCFAHNEENPLEAHMVICDEASMVDVNLMRDLVDAIDPIRTTLVLVGDHNQLPPVGAGSVLRDVIETNTMPGVVLTQVMRQAGALKENSLAILEGEVRPTDPADTKLLQDRTGVGPWYLKGNLGADAEDTLEYIRALFEKRIVDDVFGFNPVEDTQILTARHDGPLGTLMLNAFMQYLVQGRLGVELPDPVEAAAGKTKVVPRRGDKVIQTRNNYKTGLMNGTIGRVTATLEDLKRRRELEDFDNPPGGDETDNETVLVADFEGEEKRLNATQARELQLAYALTVHKAQGSEFPFVIVVCHRRHSFMQDRNWLYTAVTRAKKTCLIVGDRWGIREAAKTIGAEKRRTFLSLAGEGWTPGETN